MDFHASSQGQGYSNHHATTAFNAETSTARFIRLQSDTEPIFHDHDQDESHHHLPNDLLLEVLYRLPVKSIFRLRCVSKRWLHMLSDPSFFRCYNISRFGDDWLPWRLYFQFVHGMIFQDSSSHYNLPIQYVTSKHSAFKSSGFPLPFTSSSQQKQQPPPPPLKYYEVLSSSNDLLLLYGRPKYSREQNLYYVSNPFTKQLIALPPPPPPHPYRDGLISFGFISQVKNGVTHYKVVQFKDVREPHQPLPAHRGNVIMDLDTFSSETGEWMNSEVPLPLFSKKECHLYPAIPYNGILHWLDPRHGVIIAYDPENSTDECRLIQTPALMDNHLSGLNVVLNVCQGRLRYFETADICTGPCMVLPWRVWVLKDYDRGEWCLERSCMRREICSFDAHPDIHKRCRALMPLAFHPFDWDIMYFWCQDYILSFDLRTGWFEHEYYPIPAIGLICWWVVFQSMPPPWTKQFPPQWWDPCFDEEMITQRKGNKGILEKILEFPLRILGKGNRN